MYVHANLNVRTLLLIYSIDLLDFVMTNKGLKKLSLVPNRHRPDDLTIDDIGKILNVLPELLELEFCPADQCDHKKMAKLLNNNRSLKKVCVYNSIASKHSPLLIRSSPSLRNKSETLLCFPASIGSDEN